MINAFFYAIYIFTPPLTINVQFKNSKNLQKHLLFTANHFSSLWSWNIYIIYHIAIIRVHFSEITMLRKVKDVSRTNTTMWWPPGMVWMKLVSKITVGPFQIKFYQLVVQNASTVQMESRSVPTNAMMQFNWNNIFGKIFVGCLVFRLINFL